MRNCLWASALAPEKIGSTTGSTATAQPLIARCRERTQPAQCVFWKLSKPFPNNHLAHPHFCRRTNITQFGGLLHKGITEIRWNSVRRRVWAERASDGSDKCGPVGLLHDAMKAGPLCFAFDVRRGKHRVQKQRSLGHKSPNEASCADAVLIRHDEVKNENIWFELRGLFDGCFAVSDRATHQPARAANKFRQYRPGALVVVSNENANGHVAGGTIPFRFAQRATG